ncbi:hypothetical protein Anas_05622 [Armadillidium nasatum]|uniref:Uncharacterized protein n=1 Tax=Armadillidium nasatum TaxID=96803 RepID=A0A5N5SQ59_9CRUS|nr:hypothetical protein Anas_05622 [Armadillidium nasatum]
MPQKIRKENFGEEKQIQNTAIPKVQGMKILTRTQERRTGVMKSSKATGEYDLIPARLKSVQKETKKKLKTPPLCRRLSSSDRNILNVRPRTAIVSMPIRSSSVTKKPELPPKERVTFSDDDIATVGTAHKLELRSSRREPRMKSYSTDHFSTDPSLCHRCAQPIKQRGILT